MVINEQKLLTKRKRKLTGPRKVEQSCLGISSI